MKNILISITILMMVSVGLQAQNRANRGNPNTGGCIYSEQLTPEQRVEFAKTATAHQAAMSALREKMITSEDVNQRVNTRNQMTALRATHLAEVSDKLTNLGIQPAPTRRNGSGMGLGTGMGMGRGMGNGTRPCLRANGARVNTDFEAGYRAGYNQGRRGRNR
jgi:hypothetical protein